MSEKDLDLIRRIILLNELTFQEVHGALLKIVEAKLKKKPTSAQTEFPLGDIK